MMYSKNEAIVSIQSMLKYNFAEKISVLCWQKFDADLKFN